MKIYSLEEYDRLYENDYIVGYFNKRIDALKAKHELLYKCFQDIIDDRIINGKDVNCPKYEYDRYKYEIKEIDVNGDLNIKSYKKGSFKYWFSHWCAFQMTALNLNCWKFRFLFHDIEKPFLSLILPYNIVHDIHRAKSRHHTDYIGFLKQDYLAMIIDWECSRFTKPKAQLNAREALYCYHPELSKNILPILNKLKL